MQVSTLKSSRPDLVFVELESSSVETAAATGTTVNRLNIPLIFLSSTNDDALLERAAALLPAGYLKLPPDMSQLRLMVRAALVGRSKFPRRVDPWGRSG